MDVIFLATLAGLFALTLGLVAAGPAGAPGLPSSLSSMFGSLGPNRQRITRYPVGVAIQAETLQLRILYALCPRVAASARGIARFAHAVTHLAAQRQPTDSARLSAARHAWRYRLGRNCGPWEIRHCLLRAALVAFSCNDVELGGSQ